MVSTPPFVADFMAPIKRRPCCFFFGGSGTDVKSGWIAEASSWSGTPSVSVSRLFAVSLKRENCVQKK